MMLFNAYILNLLYCCCLMMAQDGAETDRHLINILINVCCL
jgi:hypothetical protein